VNELFRRAESILEVSLTARGSSGGTGIVLDRAGQLRILTIDGWSLAGLIREFGAREVYIVRQFAEKITVEGWSQTGSCSVTRNKARNANTDGTHTAPCSYAARLQLTPRLPL
jgi:hypothetical protein